MRRHRVLWEAHVRRFLDALSTARSQAGALAIDTW